MKTYGLSSVLATVALVATTISGQPATSKEMQRLMLPSLAPARANGDGVGQPSSRMPPPQLIGLQAHLTQAYPVVNGNSDGSDLWPCLGRGNNPDCAMIGNPPVPLPRGGIVMGRPAFTWALQNNNIIGFGLGNGTGCDALTNGTTGGVAEGPLYRPCGQIFTSYEDHTGLRPGRPDQVPRRCHPVRGCQLRILAWRAGWPEQRQLHRRCPLPPGRCDISSNGIYCCLQQHLPAARRRSCHLYHLHRARHSRVQAAHGEGLYLQRCRQSLLYRQMEPALFDTPGLEHFPGIDRTMPTSRTLSGRALPAGVAGRGVVFIADFPVHRCCLHK
jgi:hypothetical protein